MIQLIRNWKTRCLSRHNIPKCSLIGGSSSAVLLLDLLSLLIAESESTHFLTKQAPDKGCISDIIITYVMDTSK